MINSFFEEEFGHHRADNKSPRRRCGRDQAQVAPGKRGQQAKESDGEAGKREQKMFLAEDSADHSKDAAPRAKLVQIANTLHRAGRKNITAAGGQHHHGYRDPQLKPLHAAPSALLPALPSDALSMPALVLPSLLHN